MNILTLNIGSSSIKYKAFDSMLTPIISGNITGIGTKLFSWPELPDCPEASNHIEALQSLATLIAAKGLKFDAICHRIVHGGAKFTKPCKIDANLIAELNKVANLAPLHNPIQIEAIKIAQTIFSDTAQYAFFDTAFHNTMPKSQKVIPISGFAEIQKYGFHGLNYAYINDLLTNKHKSPITAIICHLGNGASVCGIKNGNSYSTSMSMTPNAGLIMGTRSGDIDAGAIIYLLNSGLSVNDVDNLINKQSGLQALCGTSDMRQCEQLAIDGDAHASLALEAFAERVIFYIGGYLALLGQIDCLVFTGGIGENSALIRNKIIARLSHLNFLLDTKSNLNNAEVISSPTSNDIYIYKANEEKYMAEYILNRCYNK